MDMMYEQDYIMRTITNLIRFLSKIIFGKDIAVYGLSKGGEHIQSDRLHRKLLALLSEGKINEAEDLLFEKFNPKDTRQMMVAIDFYQRLNNLDDEFLKENNFSRKEIEEGLRDIASKAGITIYDI
ncbi:MAG: hypothetical protein GX329_04975 [Tissierellia bacterium]|nr:hypothetical protein [Tissierellia bacterium]